MLFKRLSAKHLLAALAAVVGLSAGLSTAQAATKIRFSNDWKWEGPAAPLLTALDNGYFKDVDLDVTMDTGKGYNKPPFAIVGRKSLGVNGPKDLEGKTLGAPAPDGAYAQWQAFVKANDIAADTVKIENVGFPTVYRKMISLSFLWLIMV